MRRLLMTATVATLCACGGASTEPSADPPSAQGKATTTTTTDATSGDSCIAAHQQILDDLGQIAQEHAHGCVSDSDCTLIDLSVSCQEACRGAVTVGDAEAARDAVFAYDSDVCPSAPTACGISGSCVPVEAACADGTCTVRR